MGKTVPETKFTEWLGLDQIPIVVHKMKCIWRELNKDDFGIDGEIELVMPKPSGVGYETQGSIVKVQSKSGASYVVSDTPTSFATPVKKADLELWYSATFPTLLIVFHPVDDKLYAKEVKEFVKNDPDAFKPPYRIVFDKANDEFNENYFNKIAAIAKASPPRVARNTQEKLFSNLFLVKALPRVCEAKSKVKTADRVFKKVAGTPPFAIRGDRLMTFEDLNSESSVMRQFTKGRISDFDGTSLLDDELRSDDYIFMLNQLVKQHLYPMFVSYEKHFKRYYCRRQDRKAKSFKQDWVSIRTGKKAPPRTLVGYYEYGREKQIKFWRHLAASIRFVILGKNLYLQIKPKYLFTSDGKEPCDSEFVGPYTTRLKASEHNPQVLNHVLFWAWYLADGKREIAMSLNARTILKANVEPVTALAPFSLPLDPALYEEPVQAVSQPLLFGEDADDFEDQEDED